MSERQETSEIESPAQRLRAGRCALLLLTVAFGSPALAATPDTILCKDSSEANLHVADSELVPRVVSHEISVTDIDSTSAAMERNEKAPERLLTPQAEQAIRDAFDDDSRNDDNLLLRRPLFQRIVSVPATEATDDTNDEDADARESETTPGMNTRLPGVSDSDLLITGSRCTDATSSCQLAAPKTPRPLSETRPC